MTVLHHHSSTPPAGTLPSKVTIGWRARKLTKNGDLESLSIEASAQDDGSIIVEITSELGTSQLRAFAAEVSSQLCPNGRTVMSWKIGQDRILRIVISEAGEFLAVRSSIPATLGFPGGTYSMLLSPISSA